MNKKDIIQIAKSLYLEQTIARQLFAKFDPNKQLNGLDGSFARPSQNLLDKFCAFIDFNTKKTNIVKCIEKNGTQFVVYGININGQVDKNIKHTINGWSNLANYLVTISSQMVAPGKSFHALLKDVIQTINFKSIDSLYAPSQYQQNQMYNKLYSKNKDKQDADRFFQDWKIRQILSKWSDDVVLKLDNIINLALNIHSFSVSNKTNSVIASLNQLRRKIIDNISNYLQNSVNKLINKNMTQLSVIKTIQDYVKDNKDLEQLLIKSNEENSIKTITKDIMSPIVQNVQQLQQIVKFLQNNASQNKFASDLLDAINISNDSNSLITNCANIGFDCTKKFKDQFEQNQLSGYSKNLQKGGNQAAYWKERIQGVTNFVKHLKDTLKYSTWNDIYDVMSKRFQNQKNQIDIIDEFNSIINVCQGNNADIRDIRNKYAKAYLAVNSNKSSQQRKNQQSVILQSARNDLYTMFQSLNQGNSIVDNMLTNDESLLNMGRSPQAVAKSAMETIPYVWLKNTKILSDMIKLVDAN